MQRSIVTILHICFTIENQQFKDLFKLKHVNILLAQPQQLPSTYFIESVHVYTKNKQRNLGCTFTTSRISTCIPYVLYNISFCTSSTQACTSESLVYSLHSNQVKACHYYLLISRHTLLAGFICRFCA